MHATAFFTSLPLFVGALLSDWAYVSSHQVQWLNFAGWLLAGGLLIAGPSLLWAAADVLSSAARRHRTGMIYLLLLLATVVIGIVNSLVHAKDGAATMPAGLVLSAVVVVLGATAGGVWLAGTSRRTA